MLAAEGESGMMKLPEKIPDKIPETDEGPSSIWDALLGYGSWGYGSWGHGSWGDAEPQPSSTSEGQGRWLLEDDDFSSEHGYEPVGGRTEFAYGEFDRWV